MIAALGLVATLALAGVDKPVEIRGAADQRGPHALILAQAVSQPPGLMWNHTGRPGLAPLEIRTQPGADYFVKLVDRATGRDALGIYVRGGRPIEVEVPLGDYILKYASGQIWQGEELLFGPEPQTTYSMAENVFSFTDEGSYYSGYTVELILQTSGNLSTRDIPASQF